jgi:hypothetical protein
MNMISTQRGEDMEALLPKPLKSYEPDDLYKGLFKILSGIMKEFDLLQSDIAKILHKPPTTVSGWLNSGEVKVTKSKYTPDDVQIYELIELYDCLTSYFVRTADQVDWLRTPITAFGNKSPLNYMFEHPSHLRNVRNYLERRMSP